MKATDQRYLHRVYVAGPMSGLPEFNFPAFFLAAAKLKSAGHTVFNPAERDNDRHGVDISRGNETGDLAIAEAEHGFSLREALSDDLTWICENATAIYMLKGWEQSKGSLAELSLAKALGLRVWHQKGAVVPS